MRWLKKILVIIFRSNILRRFWRYTPINIPRLIAWHKIACYCCRRKDFLPNRASLFTHPGMGFPVSRMLTSSVKWLQFLAIKWYVSPWYSEERCSMNDRNSARDKSVLPNNTDLRKTNPGQLFGSTSNTPLVGYSCAPKPYSIPWTEYQIK